jgi:hypothetical protein
MKFEPVNPDFERSPFTGMTWQHWVDAGIMLLEGVFRALPDAESPLVLPRHETAITYPQPGHPQWRYRAEIFEGVARTLLIAAPLLKHIPDLKINGIELASYYRRAILMLCDPASPEYVGNIDAIVKESGDNPYQFTCECASLVIAMRTAKDVLWEPFDSAQRDGIAKVLSDWAHRRTHPHNWRLFNILTMVFLKQEGYAIDEAVYQDHLRAIRSFDAGDGWYRDGALFDYYSVWAFQFYGPIWADWVGYQEMPEMAQAIENSACELMKTYDRMFDRNGRQLMWGRSNIYRFAATAPFGAAFHLRNQGVSPGLARRMMSGNLLQFIGHPDFLVNGLPSIGFYGPFPPLVQPYSCAASPFWFGNGYHAVAFGPDHPLWTATEEEGAWSGIASDSLLETEISGPGIVVTQYGCSGSSEIRTGKVMIAENSQMLPNYSRLAFHTAFPWQADSTEDGLSNMQYQLTTPDKRWRPNTILYHGKRNNILYRRLLFNFKDSFGSLPSIDLADFPIKDGWLRCDRLRITEPSLNLKLCHYSLPIFPGEECQIERWTVGNGYKALVATSGNHQLALVAVSGWDTLSSVRESGLHAEAPESLLLYASQQQSGRYGNDPLKICLMLHRVNGKPFEQKDLWPFTGIEREESHCGGSSPRVKFIDRKEAIHIVDFSGMEGRLLI